MAHSCNAGKAGQWLCGCGCWKLHGDGTGDMMNLDWAGALPAVLRGCLGWLPPGLPLGTS
ncbi:hypothetical protein BIFGAL_03576 [Bifidobacterium gallicum DSM 20093 = LMG 11596]|uniref:Uncharacterized protein n=1 Tax=Bifidobacterium gallicum DSM 20093 = LMG 11596 TaxID=561180 RepID=D1NUQ0_9BIFI|nr:hypothetical protein BIFGAL_03576 [Bifidobacterium gallicum DSM 20093 = LMG 11596]